jgi:phosphate transport system substrate-binding protein
MDPAKLESGKLLQFPTVMGSVVVIVNLPGLAANQLKLTGPLLADIYEGKIAKWSDPKLAEINRGVTLPKLAIAPVYRADGSGTTYVYTSYLSAVSPSWKDHVGANTSVRWLAGAGAKGNDGVAATVHNTRGGIGYVEYAYASQNHLTTVQLRNQAGVFVAPTMEAFQAAASNGNWAGAKNFAVNLIDQPGAKTWPIESATFIELPKDPSDPARSALVMKFFDWAYKNGDAAATSLDYIPLPATVKAAVRTAWHASILGTNGKPIY